MTSRTSSDKCPLCHAHNNCAIANGEKPETCWCMEIVIPKELSEKASQNQDCCLCKKCIDEHN
ncbi:cysteine-rich CWC family protein [Fictibacillus nanhaiensis]|uniref:cysteine-rich CWC family protein n=1 Tax=Fictibacillus nanhaiensis TaxID=742169 RepID=UPI001C93F9FF|nr:cysteine-rich CWC family protein [Fictibacillus nanhaiensis]